MIIIHIILCDRELYKYKTIAKSKSLADRLLAIPNWDGCYNNILPCHCSERGMG